MKKDNRGMSLVEIIVVVSIMSILAAAGFIGVSAISGKPAQQCATNLKTALLSNRTTAMGRYSADIVIKTSSDGIVAVDTYSDGTNTNSKTSKVGDSKVTLYYSIDDGANYSAIDGTGVKIVFDRSSGSVSTINGVSVSSNILFKASKAGKNYLVKVYQLTGKVELVE